MTKCTIFSCSPQWKPEIPLVSKLKRSIGMMARPSFFFLMSIAFFSFASIAQNNTPNNFSQVTTNPPTDPIYWVYGILHDQNSSYQEGLAVPQRITLTDVKKTSNNTHTLTFKVQYTRKNGTNYAFDFLTSWATAVANAGGILDELSTVECSPHPGETVPAVCGDGAHQYLGTITGEPGLDAIDNNGDLAAYLDAPLTRNFIIYSTDPVTNATIVANSTPQQAGSNSYLLYTLTWTNSGAATSDVVIEFAAHLAKTETGYPGAGTIHGAPYHIKLDELDGKSLGDQDNQVKIGAAPTTTCSLPDCEISGSTEVCCNSTGLTYSLCNQDAEGITYVWEVTQGEAEITGGQGTHQVTVDAHCQDFVLVVTVSQDGVQDCFESHDISVTVDPLPTFGTISPGSTCSNISNGSITMTGCENDVQYQLYDCSDNSVGSAQTCSGNSVSWTGLAAGCYYIVATNTFTTCKDTSDDITVVGVACATAYTKGFWASTGKEACAPYRTAIDLLKAKFNTTQGSCANKGTSVDFGAGVYKFQLYPNVDFYSQTENNCGKSQSYIPIQKLLPGGTTPDVLHNTVTWCTYSSWATGSYVTIGNGCKSSTYANIMNNLLAQAIALKFNLEGNSALANIVLTAPTLTFNYLDCSNNIGAQSSVQYIPCSVLNYLTTNYTGTGHPNIADLFDLANNVLGHVVTTVTPADVTAAINAINVGFDRGKALVSQTGSCSGPVTSRDARAIPETINAAPSVSAFPNPFDDKVNFVIQSPVSGKATLEVFNMMGQKIRTVFNGQVFAGTPQNVEFNIPYASRVNMVYILKVNGEQLVGKLISMKQ